MVEREGTFYLTYSALDPATRKHHIAIATATHPLGPFTNRGILVRGDDNRVGVIDGHIAFDGDKAYLFYSEETPRRIVMRAMTPDLLAVGPEVVEILRPDRAWERGVVEAPFLLERDGVFHLFYSGGPYQGTKRDGRYAVGHARADRLTGPYTKTPEPILASVEGEVYGPGHCALATTPDGRTWMLYHAWDARGEPRYGSNPLGRTLRLDRLTWDRGKPRVARPSLTPQAAPAVEPDARRSP